MTTAAGAKGRRARYGEEMRQDILQAAREIIAEEGAGALSIRGIARRIGYSAPALYEYFDRQGSDCRGVVRRGFPATGGDDGSSRASRSPRAPACIGDHLSRVRAHASAGIQPDVQPPDPGVPPVGGRPRNRGNGVRAAPTHIRGWHRGGRHPPDGSAHRCDRHMGLSCTASSRSNSPAWAARHRAAPCPPTVPSPATSPRCTIPPSTSLAARSAPDSGKIMHRRFGGFGSKERNAMMRGESDTDRARHADARVAMHRARLGAVAIGAAAMGAMSVGAMAIGALAIRALVIKRGKIGHLVIEELEVQRLHVHELIVDRQAPPQMGANR